MKAVLVLFKNMQLRIWLIYSRLSLLQLAIARGKVVGIFSGIQYDATIVHDAQVVSLLVSEGFFKREQKFISVVASEFDNTAKLNLILVFVKML